MTTYQSLPSSESNYSNFIGHGIKIVEVRRIQKLIEQSGEHFEMQCFTACERSTAQVVANRIHYFAGRFAAKQAVLKALGTGWSQTISWLDIEVQRLQTGEPSVVLHGKCQKIATGLGISKWLVSISHTSCYATASAIAACSIGQSPIAFWTAPGKSIAALDQEINTKNSHKLHKQYAI
jgi:holo-[acyl-carrier protein] synthase